MTQKELKEENEQLKARLNVLENTICNKECSQVWEESERFRQENEQLKKKIGVMRSCHFNGCIGCNDKKCEVEEWHFCYEKERFPQIKKENERAKVLLKATLDLLQKQKESHYVLNLLENTVFYDNVECDGYCLFDDIENFLNFRS